MADFELNLSDGIACTGGVAGVQLRGFALKEPGGFELVDGTVAVEDFVRTVDDITQLAEYVEYNFAKRGITGPLLGLLATQVCARNHERTNDARKSTLRLERLGAWFLPTADVYPSETVAVAVEQPSSGPTWTAYTRKLGANGKPATFKQPIRPGDTAHFEEPLRGISLPRTPDQRLHAPVQGAILLSQARGGGIYGLLHRSEGQTESIEQIIAPAPIGHHSRPKMGTIDARAPRRY